VRRHEKASTAGSTEGNGKSRGLIRRAFATRGAFSTSKGSGAPKAKLAVAFGGALALVLAIGVTLASAVVPTLTIEDASSVSYTSALAKGTVDPQGKETNCHFEYVSQAQLDENVGNGGGEFDNAAGADCNGNPHEGTGAQNVEANLGGLTPSTVYHLRLVASNEDGQSEAVAADTFETEAVAKPTVTVNPVTTFTGTTAHFTGSINPNAPSGEPAGKPDAFDVNWHFQCSPDCPGAEGSLQAASTAQGVTADAAGLEPNTHYDVTLVASNAGGEENAGPVSFTTEATGPSAQTIPAFVLEGGKSALVGGRVNAHNTASTYWVEYGTDTNYGTSAPASKDAAAGSSGQDKVVTQEIGGLALNTTYHYRLVAKNAKGEVPGEDMTFKTPVAPGPEGPCSNAQFRTGPSANLPDCRAYEDVTPVNLLGSGARPQIEELSATQFFSTTALNGEAVIWSTSASVPGFDATGHGDALLSRRGPSGWTATLDSPPASISPFAAWIDYATPNLDRSFYFVYGSLDPEDPDPVETNNPLSIDHFERNSDGSYTWLTRGSAMESVVDFPVFLGASADGLKFYFNSGRKLEPGTEGGGVYLRSGQTTTLISRKEDGTPMPGANGSGISEDGSAALFGTLDEKLLYKQGLPHTLHVVSTPSGSFGLIRLSADGSKVFFQSTDPVTPDDADASTDIFEYNVATEALRRVSVPTGAPSGPGPGNGQGGAGAVAISRDGSAVYFTSPELLDGSKGVSGEENLYVAKGGVTSFLATLGGGGSAFHLSPDESTLIFQSQSRITSYDNAGHTEMYAYYTSSGTMTCVSCRPSGEPPSGDAEHGSSASTLVRNSDQSGERVFFQSTDPVLNQDVNGKTDVYEFDAASGKTSLLSTGQSPGPSMFYGNSLDGRDAFVFTLDSLRPNDINVGALKLYDARIGGGFAEPAPPAPCEGETCRSSNSGSPPPSAPATPNFVGPGNPKPKQAKKHKSKGHKKSKKHSKHKSKSHKRNANSNGRTGR
jgi:hypothetical protein